MNALAAALDDPDETVAAYSARSLGNTGKAARPAVPALVKALRGGPNLRRSAALAASRVGEDAIAPW
ncbi:MAG: HEAT repeat domain-containing protein [Gemmataceae bacterium]